MTIEVETPPLQADDSGTVRVGGTRVTLETVIESYNDGYSADQIAEAYSSVSLADVHTVIGYYLRHRQEVDAYLERQRREGDAIRRQLEAIPANAELRQRLQAAKRAREAGGSASTAGR